MLAAASSLFSRSAIYANYTISASASTSAGSQSSSSIQTGPTVPPFQVGLWKVTEATHKVTNKRVSVWAHDKRGPEVDKLPAAGKENVLAVLKAEVTALSRLRHPSVLELVFATEPLLSTLALSIPDSGSSRKKPQVELDEVEIQKGILQLAKGLSFLHTSARLVHSNLNPSSVLINAAGDWKLSGLGLTIPLLSPTGDPTRWDFPTYDNRLPAYIQRNFDYMAPEYAIDERIETGSDMYSLGCLVYAVHMKGKTPFTTHGSMNTLRENARKLENGTLGALPSLGGMDADLRSLLMVLITRSSAARPTASSIPTHAFFNALPISTLNFLDRATFAAKPREEKVAFMKGLAGVLSSFSEALKRRKILPSLLEEMKDPLLLPSILPNVFTIAEKLTPAEFASTVLPALKPLFVVRDPPQNVLAMLDNLTMIQGKTTPAVFRADVLPLVYNALDSEHPHVQERALKAVPDLCETIDYAEVQGVLFPRVALVFTKTRILSVKVNTLVCFLAMVKTLDQASLTQKLVPLLSKIRTKEPSVMLATLDVHERMGMKVDREAVATLVLPQLWAMSVGPLLNITQFQRFMQVIKSLSERIEKEHAQHLRDSQRVEDRSAIALNNSVNTTVASVDFHSLVSGGRSPSTAPGTITPIANGSNTPTPAPTTGNGWDNDMWDSMLNSAPSSPPPTMVSNRPSLSVPVSSAQTTPVTPRPITHAARALGAKPISPSIPPPPISSVIPPASSFSSPSPSTSHSSNTFSTLPPPMTRSVTTQSMPAAPNYNITLTPAPPKPNNPTFTPLTPSVPNYNVNMSSPNTAFHPGAPKFHEGQKSWTCCEKTNKPVLSFEEFQAIPGCAHGTHTSEKVAPAAPVVTAPSANKADIASATAALSLAPSAPPTTIAAPRVTTPAPPVEIVEDEDDPSIPVAPGTLCKRPGCRKQFVSDEESRQGDGEAAQCNYHANQPLFHEGSKGYVCCKKHVLDFDDFLAIPGCKTGKHVFAPKIRADRPAEEIVKSRIDHYQTPTEVRVSVYAKQVDQSRSTVVLETDKIVLDLFLPAGKRDKRTIALFGTIDTEASSYKFYGTKVDVILVKTDNRSWNALQADAVVPEGYQLTFGVTGRTGTVGAKDPILDQENKRL
ncbi:unnamed protein product [Rhizoctonia solani]|uniref:Protein kinase domain-containing protein n=1 Tax=Rhizoctonia solani TaxID=456999 RepID=A0A8H3BMU6_9AGAM|nr:unnamed protein product [Rhizoctonia solani]